MGHRITNNSSPFLQTIGDAIKGVRLIKVKPTILTKSLIRGDLPSEQIFYRNIPLGAPDSSHRVDLIFNFIFNFNFIKVSQNNKHLQLGLVVI